MQLIFTDSVFGVKHQDRYTGCSHEEVYIAHLLLDNKLVQNSAVYHKKHFLKIFPQFPGSGY